MHSLQWYNLYSVLKTATALLLDVFFKKINNLRNELGVTNIEIKLFGWASSLSSYRCFGEMTFSFVYLL